MNRGFGRLSRVSRCSIAHFPLIYVDHLLQCAGIFLGHIQLILKCVVLFGGLRGFRFQPRDPYFGSVVFGFCVIFGLLYGCHDGFGLAHSVRVHPFKVICLMDEGFVLLLNPIEFRPDHEAFLHDRIIGALADTAVDRTQSEQSEVDDEDAHQLICVVCMSLNQRNCSNLSERKNTRSLVRNHQLDVFVLSLERWQKRLPGDSQNIRR